MKRKSGMVTQILSGDEIMVVPTEGNMINKVLTLNGSGGFVWNLLENERSLDELIQALVNEYGICEREAREDLTDFLETIKDYI